MLVQWKSIIQNITMRIRLNLNAAIAGTDMEGKTIENILINLDMKNMPVRNNGGGFTITTYSGQL
jgi:hypothetical protein